MLIIISKNIQNIKLVITAFKTRSGIVFQLCLLAKKRALSIFCFVKKKNKKESKLKKSKMIVRY